MYNYMKCCFCVIHCNRLFYLKNCVKSILDFINLEGIHLLIIDNGSVESGVREYLSSLPSFIGIKQIDGRHPNELHRSMNFAIQYCKKNKIPYVNFIQDDYQYVYKIPDLLSWVSDVFDFHSDIVQLNTNMVWKYKNIGKYNNIIVNGIKWYKLLQKTPCDNGITRVSFYDKIGLYPETVSVHGREKGYIAGESWFKEKCKNFYRAMLSTPNMAMLMDCAYVRGDKRIGKYEEPPNDYYLEPLTENDYKVVVENSNSNKVCFIEDLIKPFGWVPEIKTKHSIRNCSYDLK